MFSYIYATSDGILYFNGAKDIESIHKLAINNISALLHGVNQKQRDGNPELINKIQEACKKMLANETMSLWNQLSALVNKNPIILHEIKEITLTD